MALFDINHVNGDRERGGDQDEEDEEDDKILHHFLETGVGLREMSSVRLLVAGPDTPGLK